MSGTTNQPDDFDWFANKISDYRDYYRGEMLQYYPADSIAPAAFGLLLETAEEHTEAVRATWQAAGVAIATVGGLTYRCEPRGDQPLAAHLPTAGPLSASNHAKW